MPAARSPRGQATVELVAMLPLVVLLALVAWQLAVAGQARWLAGSAARAAARAEAVGQDPSDAARRVLPARLEAGLRVVRRTGGGVEVTLPVPLVGTAGRLASVSDQAQFAPQAP